MNLKMAENSLFAILLRSSWWISAAVAVAFVFIARALLPAEYFIVGAMGALPFAVIAAVSAWKQLRRPSAASVAATRERVATMSWPQFSQAIEEAFRRSGYAVRRPAATDDVDFELTRNGRTFVVGCKRWKAARTGLEPIRSLQAARERCNAQDGLFIATGEISDKARAYAAANRIRVVEAPALTQLLRGAGLPDR